MGLIRLIDVLRSGGMLGSFGRLTSETGLQSFIEQPVHLHGTSLRLSCGSFKWSFGPLKNPGAAKAIRLIRASQHHQLPALQSKLI